MTREVSIPIALWACAAIVVHAIGSGSIVGVTVVQEKLAKERASIRHMVNEVRDEFDVVYVEDDGSRPPKQTVPEPVAPEVEKNPVLSFIAPLSDLVMAPFAFDLPKPETKPEEEKSKPEPELAKKEDPPKPDPKEEEEEEKKPDPKRPELIMLKDNRISIRQVTEKDEKDNPNAPRLADKARTVEEETIARFRSTDTVSKDPSPGSNQRGPTNEEGNSQKSKTAQAEDAEGDPKRAPGEKAERSPDNHHALPRPPAPATANKTGGPGKAGAASPGGIAKSDAQPAPAVPGSIAGAGPRAPELVTSDGGYSDEVPEAAPGGAGVGAVPGVNRPMVPGSLTSVVPKAPGLGASGAAGKISLSWQGFVSAVSEETLEKERAAAGQKMRSEHRGRYDTNKFERFLPDIENYDPSVKLGNQTALSAAQSLFAGYLSTIHNAIHPIFADEFLALLNSLPKGHELNQGLVTHVEIVLSRDEGKIMRRGVTRQSGSTVFDAAALDAIDRAALYGAAPDAVVSSDGNVYLHWEFHRDPVDACSTRNAHPFMVKDPKPIKQMAPLKKKPKQKQPKREGEAPKKGSPPGSPAPAEPADKPGPLPPLRKK